MQADLDRAPFFVRGPAKEGAEKYAREVGASEVTMVSLFVCVRAWICGVCAHHVTLSGVLPVLLLLLLLLLPSLALVLPPPRLRGCGRGRVSIIPRKGSVAARYAVLGQGNCMLWRRQQRRFQCALGGQDAEISRELTLVRSRSTWLSRKANAEGRRVQHLHSNAAVAKQSCADRAQRRGSGEVEGQRMHWGDVAGRC